MFKTHLVIALLVGIILTEYLNPTYPLLFLGVICLASALPDIDTPRSKVGKKVGFLSNILNLTLGHRGVMHSLYFPVAVFLLGIFLGFPLIAYAFLIGYLIHLLTDAMTKDGIHLFYPFVNIKGGFFATGSIWETLVFFVVVGLIVLKISAYF